MDIEKYEPPKEQASDEDTEDASEAEEEKKEETCVGGIKEQMYLEKISHLRQQLDQLRGGSLPSYTKKIKKLQQADVERKRGIRVFQETQNKRIKEDYDKEVEAAYKDYEEKAKELKESLIQELEMKKKSIEHERTVMELTGDMMAVKPVTTRKLRRRPNDPVPVPEKRGNKPSPVQLTHGLDDTAITDDIIHINRVTGKSFPTTSSTALPASSSKSSSSLHSFSHPHHSLGDSLCHEASIEDGRLLYDKKWFLKDHTVQVECRDTNIKTNAIITSFTSDEVVMKKIIDSGKLRVSVNQLQTGYYTLKKRTAS